MPSYLCSQLVFLCILLFLFSSWFFWCILTLSIFTLLLLFLLGRERERKREKEKEREGERERESERKRVREKEGKNNSLNYFKLSRSSLLVLLNTQTHHYPLPPSLTASFIFFSGSLVAPHVSVPKVSA